MEQYHYFQKDKGKIIQVPLNEWVKYRKQGYVHVPRAAFVEQQSKSAEKPAEKPAPVAKPKAKVTSKQK